MRTALALLAVIFLNGTDYLSQKKDATWTFDVTITRTGPDGDTLTTTGEVSSTVAKNEGGKLFIDNTNPDGSAGRKVAWYLDKDKNLCWGMNLDPEHDLVVPTFMVIKAGSKKGDTWNVMLQDDAPIKGTAMNMGTEIVIIEDLHKKYDTTRIDIKLETAAGEVMYSYYMHKELGPIMVKAHQGKTQMVVTLKKYTEGK